MGNLPNLAFDSSDSQFNIYDVWNSSRNKVRFYVNTGDKWTEKTQWMTLFNIKDGAQVIVILVEKNTQSANNPKAVGLSAWFSVWLS